MLDSLIRNAIGSRAGLLLLNGALQFVIPFNGGHGLRVKEITAQSVSTFLPYKRSNYNHVKGIHACALAAAAEFSTGLRLLSRLGFKQYRIIMTDLKMKYHYQAKKAVTAVCTVDDGWIVQHVLAPLKDAEKITTTVESELHDTEGNHIATGTITWQVKPWSAVRTGK